MPGHPFDTFGTKHLVYIGGMVLVWLVVLYLGIRHFTPGQRKKLVLGLAIFSLAQELADDLLRVHHGVWAAESALPFHLCSLGMLVSVWALLSRKQLVFEVAYFWVLAAATQAILTPDNTRWRLGELDVFWNFLSHGVIMLNVFWLAFVEGMRCRKWSWLKAFFITNLMIIPISVINLILKANYFFICWRPGGESPFLLGEWPWYILWFEAFGFVFFLLLYLPMWLANRPKGARPAAA